MTLLKLIQENPLFLVNEFLDSQVECADECVTTIANSCIEGAMRRFEGLFPNDDIRASITCLQEDTASSLNGRMVRFCGLIVQEGDDDFFVPLRKSGDKWCNVGLFKNPEAMEDDEFPDHRRLIKRRNMEAHCIPYWSHWSGSAFSNSQDWAPLRSAVNLILYSDGHMDTASIGKEYEIYGILDWDESSGCSVHVLSLVQPSNGLNYQKLNFQLTPDEVQSTKASLLNYISQVFDGNQIAAELFLAHLVSKTYDRIPGLLNSLLLGHFPLNIRLEGGCGSAEDLHKLVSSLMPAVCPLEISPEALGAVALSPSFNADTNELEKGRLQLAKGTHLIVDETKLAECQFSERATKNIQALMELLDHQHVTFDFGVQSVEMKTDLPILSVSSGKSILPIPWSVKANIVHPVEPGCGEDKMAEWRSYISHAKEVEVTLSEDVGKRLEKEYVGLRKADNKRMDENEFSRVLNLAKLLAKSDLQTAFAWEHWARAYQIYQATSA